MRSAVVLVGLLGCGANHAHKDAAAGGEPIVSDAAGDAPTDAPVLPACASPVQGTNVTLRRLPDKVFGISVLATAPAGDPRLFVVECQGRIRIYKDEVLAPDPFLDLTAAAGGPVAYDATELGLLGLAFHPEFAANGLFYVYYTTGDLAANTLRDVVTRCHVSATDPDVADPTSCTEILSIPDPGRNHNGGMIEFGPDRLLYIGTGDGGGPTQLATSQDPTSLLGKMLRIDVDHPTSEHAYGIPGDNPFAAGGGAPEVWMTGLRNPWRWTFDATTGDLWIGDVGRSDVEELDVLSAQEQRGANLGWPMYEGSECFQGPCDPSGKTFPKDERQRATSRWAAIIGGQVYRGTCYPDLAGWYFYADDEIGAFARARLQPDRTLEVVDLTSTTFPPRPASLHADARGELYVTDVSGFVYHLEAGP